MSFIHNYRQHYRDNLYLAIPIVISQLGYTLVQTADTIIVGHFAGTVSLAAVSLANSIFVILLMVGIGVSYGITPLIAQSNGRNDDNECGKLLSNGLIINVITGLFLFIITYLASIILLDHLDQTPEVVRQAKPFLTLLGLSIIPMLVFNTFKQFAEGLGYTKQAMVISVWGNVLNIIVGITLVKGLFGITPMGINGVGYSTLIDRCVMAVVMGFYVFKSGKLKKFVKEFNLFDTQCSRFQEILKIGVPVALQFTFELGAFSGAAIIVGTIGYYPQAAHQVAINLGSITYMMASGLSAAAAIKSGNYLGSGDHYSLRRSAISNYHIVLLFMGITAIIFTLFNHLFPWIYTSDKKVIDIAAQLIIIVAFFQLFDGTQVVGLGILRGMGDVNIPTIFTFIAYWIVGLPLGYILGITLHLGVKGVWYGLLSGLLTASVLLFFRFQYISKKYTLKINN